MHFQTYNDKNIPSKFLLKSEYLYSNTKNNVTLNNMHCVRLNVLKIEMKYNTKRIENLNETQH